MVFKAEIYLIKLQPCYTIVISCPTAQLFLRDYNILQIEISSFGFWHPVPMVQLERNMPHVYG